MNNELKKTTTVEQALKAQVNLKKDNDIGNKGESSTRGGFSRNRGRGRGRDGQGNLRQRENSGGEGRRNNQDRYNSMSQMPQIWTLPTRMQVRHSVLQLQEIWALRNECRNKQTNKQNYAKVAEQEGGTI